MVRAKMTVTEIHETGHGASNSQHKYRSHRVVLSAQYDQSIPEDQRFQKATPSGSISMQIDNPAALEQFEIGKQFYVDFTLAE